MLKRWVTKGTSAKQSLRRDVVEGRVPGFKFNRKFGRTDLIEADSAVFPFDIWEGGDIPLGANGAKYPWDVANEPMYICSSSALDTDIDIMYFPQISDGTFPDVGVETREFITIQGQTVIQLPDCLNILRAVNATTVLPLAQHKNIGGTIYIFRGGAATAGVPNNLSDIRNVINNGNNKTQCACVAVPQGFVGAVEKGEVGLSTDMVGNPLPDPVACTAALRVIQRGAVVSTVEKSVPLVSSGQSMYTDTALYPELVPAGGKVSLSVEEMTGDARFIGEFTIALKEESLYSDKVLAEIGQPGYI